MFHDLKSNIISQQEDLTCSNNEHECEFSPAHVRKFRTESSSQRAALSIDIRGLNSHKLVRQKEFKYSYSGIIEVKDFEPESTYFQ